MVIDSPWLTGWKSIAEYLGVHPRTALRYHEEGGMPVRPAGPWGGVCAHRDEIDKWRLKLGKEKAGE